MIYNDTATPLPVALLHVRASTTLRWLNTIKDLLIATEGKVVGVIDCQIQPMRTGNQLPRTIMAISPMLVNSMAAPFMPSKHHQP
jgi:hypothetical protein